MKKVTTTNPHENSNNEADIGKYDSRINLSDDVAEDFHPKARIYNILFENESISPDDYSPLIHSYKFYNISLVEYLHSKDLKLTLYEMLLCIFSFERMPLQQTSILLGKNENALKKAHQRIKEKIKMEKEFHYLSEYLRSLF